MATNILKLLNHGHDDGADVAFEEWQFWYNPKEWLSPSRALGAFIRLRLDGRLPKFEERLEKSARDAVRIFQSMVRDHSDECDCRRCVAVSVLYAYHCMDFKKKETPNVDTGRTGRQPA